MASADRVAALYDIHGNIPALDAVLDEIRGTPVDLIVVGGDIVPGPMQTDVLRRLVTLDVPVEFIQGNCEVAVLDEIAGRDPGVPASVREIMRWSADDLSLDDRARIAAWPKTLRVEVSGIGEVLFCHGTPRHENEIFTRLTPEEQLVPIIEPSHAQVVVCGHTHMPFDRMVGATRVVNAGSVGMPFCEPGAYWLQLGPGVTLRHTAYDLTAAAERVRATPYPQAQQFAETYVLHPPSEAAMTETFEKVALHNVKW
jgi:putative phosphoesterase